MQIKDENTKITLLALIITVLFLFFLFLFCRNLIQYYCDDPGMISILQKGTDGIADPNAIFLSPLLSSLLYKLYSIFDQIPWYFIVMYLAQGVAFFFGTHAILTLFKDTFLRICVFSLFLLLSFPIFIRVNFTSVSLFLWFMTTIDIIIALLYKKLSQTNSILAGLLLSFSLLIRPSVSKISLISILPLLILFFFIPKGWKKLLFIILGLLPLLLISSIIGKTKPYNNSLIQNYHAIQKCRSLVIDTKGLTLSSDGNIGLSKNDLYCLQLWFVHDEMIFNRKNLEETISAKFNHLKMINPSKGLQNLIISGFTWLILLIAFFILNLRRDDGPNLNSIQLKKCNLKLYLILVSLYVLFFNLTLCLIRYPKRIHIPLLTFLFFLLIFNSMFIDVKSKQKIRTQTKFLICLLTIILLFFYIHSFYVQNKKLDKINNYKQKVYAYLQLDSIEECLLISIPRRNFKTSPFLVDNQVSIPTIPGGWTINSLYYYKYLHSISIQNGHNLCLKCIDSNQFRISYWCTMDQDFPVIQKTLSTFFNDHYDPVFRSIDIKKVADYRQYISPNEYEGLVFFKVIKLNEKAK